MSHTSTKIQLLIYSEYTISITIGPHKQIWISEVSQNSYENKMFECLYFKLPRLPDLAQRLAETELMEVEYNFFSRIGGATQDRRKVFEYLCIPSVPPSPLL